MSEKMIKVNECFECPHYDHDGYCERVQEHGWSRPYKIGGIIPEWCPLEDAPEDKVFCDYCGKDREKCTCESGNFIPESMCESEKETCTWTQDDPDFYEGHRAECGCPYTYFEDAELPADWKFCPGCGKPIHEIEWTDEQAEVQK